MTLSADGLGFDPKTARPDETSDAAETAEVAARKDLLE